MEIKTPWRRPAIEPLCGLQEWNTDQDIDAEATKDADAQKAADKAAEEDVCVPIGEGENCW